jgi:hypothetical protein
LADGLVIAGLDDDAYLLDPRGGELQQMIVQQCAGDAVGADDGEELLFHRV